MKYKKMNIACFFGILIIIMGDASAIEKNNNKAIIGQRILLRKLQNFQNTPRNDGKSVTWNEFLADVLVKKIFHFNSSEEPLDADKSNSNILKESVSQILAAYKFVYDKFREDDVDNLKGTHDPKDDVEVIQPRNGVESCDDCVAVKASKDTGNPCVSGQIKNENGDCVDSTPVKLILSVPNQCPIGYRADRLGFCRIRF
ncbi:unnamed protein product [Diatraea saccharalis]|uniref:Uncharacterized protein n=1 Tax=Diatraea saccharalis TaxID=40085 RepID=A0A9N9R0C6_9NEOP|nr:unnamed protein product [Diatraea saccharalis]